MSNSSFTPDYGAFGEWKSDDSLSGSAVSSRSASTASDASLSSNASSSKDLSKAPRKLSMIPSCDPEEEMRDEIEQSVNTGECNLSALGLTALPPDVPLSSLWKLCLAENRIAMLPSSLFHDDAFSKLQDLDLNTNALSSLPLSLFYLPALKVLSLNTNKLASLPFEGVENADKNAHGDPFLPNIRRIGIESNRLRQVPIGFLQWCPRLEELLLAMNENILDAPVPYEPLAALHPPPSRHVLLKLDNRPRFVQQTEEQQWATTLPWLNLVLNKIYPDKVLDYLFLGSLRTAQTVTVYRDLDIGYVLTLGRNLEVKVEPGMKQLVIVVDDLPEQGMVSIFEEAFRFIDEARTHHKGVLIHCFAGLSRSVTIAVAYVMHLKGMTRDAALEVVRKARPAAKPNDGFMKELLTYEGVLRKEHIIKD